MTKQLKAVDLELEISIAATKTEVWSAMVNDLSLWWPKGAFMTSAKKMVLEPRVGGRVYEDDGKGNGGVWWYVHAIQKDDYLILLGHIWPGNGGPAASVAKLSLEKRGKETILKIHDSMFGRLTDARVEQIKSGWNSLFAESLKPYAETKRPTK
jgi:uncharacterized protein YndB with AHSA1/START domain